MQLKKYIVLVRDNHDEYKYIIIILKFRIIMMLEGAKH